MSLVSESDTLFSNPGVPSTSGTIGGIPVQKKSPREVKSGQNPRDIVAEADMHEFGIFCSTTDTLEMEEDFKNALKISNNPIGCLASLLIPTEEDLKPKQLFAAAHQHSTEMVLRQVGGINSVLNNLKTTVMLPVGEVFTFNAVDTDKDGNLFSHINYDTPTAGQRTDQYGRRIK